MTGSDDTVFDDATASHEATSDASWGRFLFRDLTRVSPRGLLKSNRQKKG
jgi:hypothetical protein